VGSLTASPPSILYCSSAGPMRCVTPLCVRASTPGDFFKERTLNLGPLFVSILPDLSFLSLYLLKNMLFTTRKYMTFSR